MKLNKDSIIRDFRHFIRFRTVSSYDGGKTDKEEFRKLREFIRQRFDVLFKEGENFRIGEYGLLIRIPGEHAGSPSVLMAHMDVVDADADGWKYDPFSAEVHDGRIWGRGTLDTKCTLFSVLTAMENRLLSGFKPQHDIWLAFGGEEEISGTCASEIVSFLKDRGVAPAFVLDEGGSVIPEGLPGVHRQAAMIGIAEKGTANYRISIRSGSGGHASVPPKSTVIGRLAKAAVTIEKNPFPARLSEAVKIMFRELAPEAPVYARPAFMFPEASAPFVAAAASFLGGTFNAMVRTTTAVTVMEGNSSFNVLPDRAEMGINARILEGDTVEGVAKRLEKLAGDPDIRVEVISGSEPTPVSDIRCYGYEVLKKTIGEVWKDTITAPYQMNGGTDSRFFSGITNHIFRFSPMVMTKEERASVHGKNESIAVENLYRMIIFYEKLIDKL